MNVNTFLGGRIKEYIPPYRTQPGTRWLRPNGPGNGFPYPEIYHSRHLGPIGTQIVMADKNGIGTAFEERMTTFVCSCICYGCDRNARGCCEVPDAGNERRRCPAVRFEVDDHHVGPLGCRCTQKAKKRPPGPPGVSDPGNARGRGIQLHCPAHQARGMDMVVNEHE